jgi:hypothetical protein
MRLRDLLERTMQCKQEYWDLPKDVRIANGLRPEPGAGTATPAISRYK